MTIKKAYTEISKVLEANAGKVLTPELMKELNGLMEAKSGGGAGVTSAIFDVDGKPVAIKDYFFGRWMPLVGDKAVEFGAKASSKTKLNTMSKEGVSHWTKLNSAFKKGKDAVMEQLLAGKIDGPKAQTQIEALEKTRTDETAKAVKACTLGFNDRKGVEKYLRDNKVSLPQS